jgi:hypothetical protein
MNTRLSLIVAVAALPYTLSAQDSAAISSPTPFRGGQWAAQFEVGYYFTSVGFLKFSSPTRALVVDLRLTGSHGEGSRTDTAGTRYLGFQSDAVTQLRLGFRRFRTVEHRIAPHYSLGVLAGLNHHASGTPGFKSESNEWTAGAYGDIGATYLVTSSLGLGALATVSLAYTLDHQTSQPSQGSGSTVRSWLISGSAVNASLVATLFF